MFNRNATVGIRQKHYDCGRVPKRWKIPDHSVHQGNTYSGELSEDPLRKKIPPCRQETPHPALESDIRGAWGHSKQRRDPFVDGTPPPLSYKKKIKRKGKEGEVLLGIEGHILP